MYMHSTLLSQPGWDFVTSDTICALYRLNAFPTELYTPWQLSSRAQSNTTRHSPDNISIDSVIDQPAYPCYSYYIGTLSTEMSGSPAFRSHQALYIASWLYTLYRVKAFKLLEPETFCLTITMCVCVCVCVKCA